MDKGICNYTIIPVRREPSERSEMVTQILFGETYSICTLIEKWAEIIIEFDGYKGWIDKKLITHIETDEFERINRLDKKIVNKLFCTARIKEQEGHYHLLLGSEIGPLNNNCFSIAGIQMELTSPHDGQSKQSKREKIINTALQLLNIPYLWGGRSSFGIDCSGLVQTSYKVAGIHMLRDASQQATQGKTLDFINDAIPGDILFFDNLDGNIVHTGILLTNNTVIHSSGTVRIDSIDQKGIFNHEIGEFTHKLRLIKRIVE